MSVPCYGDYPEDHTKVIIAVNTFDSNDPSASVTITNLAAGDIHIHKDGAVAQKTTSNGITVSINFDGITGNHLVIIDTSNDTGDAGFWVTGKEYQVRMEGTTVDAATINAFIGTFSIERAGGTIALLKLIQAAVITNAAGADVAADIIAVKAETAVIVNDTDVIDDGTSGLVKIAQDVAAILVDTGTTIPGTITTAQNDLDTITGTGGVLIGTNAMDRSGTLDVNTKTITAGAITATAIATDAIDADALKADAVDLIWDEQPATVAIALRLMIERIYRETMNKANVTDATGAVALRNEADNADIATGNISDDDTTTVRAALSWV